MNAKKLIKNLEADLRDHNHHWFDFEFETDEDNVFVSFNYNIINQCFEVGLSIYHASEDNNGENVESHTDEITIFGHSIDELINRINDEYFLDFRSRFISYLKKEGGDK